MDPSPTSPTLVKTEYSDGFGRLLQTRAQAEEVLFGDATFGGSGLPADPLAPNEPAVGVRNNDPVNVNVVVSGWQVYDNKGRVVEKYEPFFSKGFAFVLAEAAAKGQCVKMHHDPRGQVIRTINPDGSQQRVIYGYPGAGGLGQLEDFVPSPWETYSYDANDLASLTHPRQGLADLKHAFTPQSSEIDALGRVIRTRDRLGSTAPAGSASEVLMQYAYDIRGNRVQVTDALGRVSFRHVYDLKPKAGEQDSGANVLFTQHLDGGTHTANFDGAGQPLRGTDAKGALTLHAYDQLGRPTQAWARDQTGEVVRRRQHLVYGTDATQNNNGQLVEHYDEAGRLRLTAFDFKGNLLEKSWQVVADEVFTQQWAKAASKNWAVLPAGFNEHWDDLSPAAVMARLAPQVYVTSTGYDGLNRATQLLLPAEPGRGGQRPVLQPVYNRAGALAQVSLDGEVLVRQLAYNARGQRLLLARGNGLVTRYTYDQVMFRLQRLRTEGYAGQGLTLTPQSGTTRQDTLYTYDLSGNITATRERAPQSGVGGTDELVRGFTYDALYRLLSATGRENQPTAARPWQESTRSDGVASTTAYTQRYEYDELGNIRQLRHVASNSANSFTRSFDYGSGATNYLQTVQLGATIVAYQYDAAGNVVQENGSRHYQWDAADQLQQFTTWTGTNSAPTLLAYYLYAGGQRVKKLTQTSADTWQVTVYAEGGFEHRYEVSSNNRTGEQTQVAVFDGQHRLYQRRSGDSLGDQRPDKLYALDDHLGSTAAQTDASGSLVSREEYYPFGETSFGSHQKQRYRFCGKELDQESGLYYYGMRYYAAWLCRFVSVDPLAAKYDYYTPYQYAGNKPIIAVDIDGLEASVDTSQQATRGTPANPIQLAEASVVGCKPEVNQVESSPIGADDGYMADRKKMGLSGTNAASEPSSLTLMLPAVETATEDVLMQTDAGDAAILATWKTRGYDHAIKLNGQLADKWDKRAAVAGAFIPVIAGALLKNAATGVAHKVTPLLHMEGNVGTYTELKLAGNVGDNVTPHHIPSAKHMEQHGIPRKEGLSINVEQPVGKGTSGGRHGRTFTYGTQADELMSSRDALAAGVRDIRDIWQADGVYTPELRQKLLDLIARSNKDHPIIFKK